VPLSTALYLPALPAMTSEFNVPEVLITLTLILFFLFYSVASLVWGPLSDKYGRRPILLIGLIGYTGASLLCAVSPSVYMLIVCRVLQAIGAGAAAALAAASSTAQSPTSEAPKERGGPALPSTGSRSCFMRG
jgi:DHA1 family bicyclomycin/chloramphenicol resistance-like MFS transporter